MKKIFIRSGIRFDYMLQDKNNDSLDELVQYHVSGQLKVAPEHASNKVLDKMGKPHIEVYEEFEKRFYAATKKCGKEQYLVPYLMSSHPGCTLEEAVELAVFLKKHNIRPEQVQDFYPTPGTISTAMFWTGLDPYTMEPVFVPRTPEEKRMQRALLQYFKPENHDIVEKALIMAHRRDLIGTGRECLIPPGALSRNSQQGKAQGRNGRPAGNSRPNQGNTKRSGRETAGRNERGSVNGRRAAPQKKPAGKHRG